jgi:ATP-binding cassette subfamily C (CFTR/MRP) protein 1
MLAFITYSLTKHSLDPAPIFSSLALFNALRTPLSVLPWVIGQIIDAWSSVRRIQEYLSAEDIKDETIWDYEGRNAVEMKDASFTWERATAPDAPEATGSSHDGGAAMNEGPPVPEASDRTASSPLLTERGPFNLTDLNFSIGRKELIAVIGGVGSGKSSLLAALAGDMRMANGEMIMGASRGFCPQSAWIQNATVRDNILFGKAYDAEWYSSVVDACALRPDIEMLADGDLTEVGERGITISGGQRQRMNIARAIYFGADIVLLDDPLSSVDAHVGRHIFDRAICGLLKDKCRILATNQLHVLGRCDRIIWLEGGRIVAVDTFDNLIANNEAFSTMMARISQEEEGEEGRGRDGRGIEDDLGGSPEPKKNGGALMQVEERAIHSVPWSVYGSYISASGNTLNAPLALALLVISQAGNIATGLWLSWWSANKWHLSVGQYVSVLLQRRANRFGKLISVEDWRIRRFECVSDASHLLVLHYPYDSRYKCKQGYAPIRDEAHFACSYVVL